MKLEALDQEHKSVKYLLKIVDSIIENVVSGEGLFVTKSVYELLWGYKDNLLSDIKKAQDDTNAIFKTHIHIVDSDEFGLGVSVTVGLIAIH